MAGTIAESEGWEMICKKCVQIELCADSGYRPTLNPVTGTDECKFYIPRDDAEDYEESEDGEPIEDTE